MSSVPRAFAPLSDAASGKLPRLLAAGWLTSARGRKGGIRLARPADQISLGAVIRHTEADFDLVGCSSCIIAPACGLTQALDEATQAFLAVLDRQTLADVLARRGDFLPLLRQPGDAA